QAGQALQRFAECFGVPWVETQAGKGTISSEHELNLGGIGETGCLAANTLAKQADLVIGVGTRYTDFTTSSKWLFQNPDVSFLNINVSAFDAGKLDGLQLLADAREALSALHQQLGSTGYQADW
ncbi:3D-(3,5/4)-trihydroxycyclohexane-1,2-dione acylhydrolase (decyclizing), partial [Yersinia enterocolitica]|nr:3D-(3,5/4)-trihydroxycyclohexane-1,2-dione acylhydrolase (decyclizing) [Yersinia enterocolitica]